MEKIKSAFLANCFPEGTADRFELCEEMDYLLEVELADAGLPAVKFDTDEQRIACIDRLLVSFSDDFGPLSTVELLTALKKVLESDEQEFEIES